MPTTQASRGPIAYGSRGSGAPILLLPSGGHDLHDYDELRALLPNRFGGIGIDSPATRPMFATWCRRPGFSWGRAARASEDRVSSTYYSTVFSQPAERVWAAIRDFGDYQWAGTAYQATLENGQAGDAVGAVRRVRTGAESFIRQRLLAHSDIDRSYTYEFCEPCPFPVSGYRATLRVTPVVDGDRSFVEWWASFDCAPEERERWASYFRDDGFATWLSALRARLD